MVDVVNDAWHMTRMIRSGDQAESRVQVKHRTIHVNGTEVFYREAGVDSASAVLLLHGFPSSSYQFRCLLPALADRYHVFAPDLPGFGFSACLARSQYSYTFEHY